MARNLPGTLLWWCPSLDDTNNGSTTTIGDLSGNGRSGTLTNMESGDWVADTNNGGIRALSFDGSNEYINLSSPTFMSSLSTETISFWLYRDTTARTCSFGRRNGTNYNIVHIWNDSRIYWMVGANKYAYSSYTGTGWHHYCFVFDGTQSTDSTKYTGYVDAVSQSLTFSGSPMPTSTPSNTDALTAALGAGLYALCKMDDMRVFNRALTSAEVTLLASMRAYQPYAAGTHLLIGAA